MLRSCPTTVCSRAAFALLIAQAGILVSVAQEPAIHRIDATNTQPGQTATLSVHGENLTNVLALWTPFAEFSPLPPAEPPNDKLAVFEGFVPPDAAVGVHLARVITQQGVSGAAALVVDDLPFTASGAAEDPSSPVMLRTADSTNGFVNPLATKYFSLELPADEAVRIEVFARRLSSDLDPVLRLTSALGSEVAFCDDVAGLEGDARIEFTPATAGRYLLELRDVRYGGSPRHFFHLRIGGRDLDIAASRRPVACDAYTRCDTEPNNARESATPVAAETRLVFGAFDTAGDSDWFRVSGTANQPLCVTARTREFGSPADVVLQLWNADGSMLAENDDTAPGDAQLATTLPADGDYFLAVNELTQHGGSSWTYVLEWNQGPGRIEVTSAADHVTVPHSGSASLTLNVKRIGHSGPLRIVTTGLPDSLVTSEVFLAANQDTVPVTITSNSAADAERSFVRGPLHVTAFTEDTHEAATAIVAPPAADKTPNAPYRSIQLSPELFVATKPQVAVSLNTNVEHVTLSAGKSAEITIAATRVSDWTQPIEIAATVPNQLPPGITVSATTIEGDAATMTISADANAVAGKYSLFLQGTSKKDDTTITQPVPPILIHVE